MRVHTQHDDGIFNLSVRWGFFFFFFFCIDTNISKEHTLHTGKLRAQIQLYNTNSAHAYECIIFDPMIY